MNCRNFLVGLSAMVYFSLLSGAYANPQTGKVSYPTLGIEFNVPEGWKGQETEQGFLIVSNTERGLIAITTHTYKNLDAVKQEAAMGISEGSNIQLQLAGSFNQLAQKAIGAEFTGLVQGQSARAYVAGVINPYGTGVSIMALTTTEYYSTRYVELVKQIVSSLKFSAPKIGPIVAEWSQTLQGATLTYMNSYYSSGPSYGGYMTGGGYSSKVIIQLCRNGQFSDSRNSSLSVDTGGAFGGSSGSNQDSGRWRVIANVKGGASLQLNYPDGSVGEYALEYKDKKTFLNGTRYFRTYDSPC